MTYVCATEIIGENPNNIITTNLILKFIIFIISKLYYHGSVRESASGKHGADSFKHNGMAVDREHSLHSRP